MPQKTYRLIIEQDLVTKQDSSMGPTDLMLELSTQEIHPAQ